MTAYIPKKRPKKASKYLNAQITILFNIITIFIIDWWDVVAMCPPAFSIIPTVVVASLAKLHAARVAVEVAC